MRVYNSLTKKKEEFIPAKDKIVNMYSCGVTVYDKCHIGHARSLYIFDVIRKYLKFRGYDVNFVRNITDVDDKIIDKANELNMNFDDVVRENITLYEKDLKSLGVDKADIEPRATENIIDMVKHIEMLIKKGYAYEVDGDVYFKVRKFPDYGKLSGQSVEKMYEAVRICQISKKKDPLDFALWKSSKDNEPAWDGPLGKKGRPGWHIECSCMSMKYLKCETLDIHAGGRDLIFPHHENEIAQSEALTGKQFAKYWIHHGLLTINGQKMSKSLGNFITVQDAIKKYDVDDIKMLFLLSHYTSSVDFSEEKMIESHKALGRIKIFFSEAEKLRQKDDALSCDNQLSENLNKNFISAMDDNFNTPKAFGKIFEVINETYKLKGQKNYVSTAISVMDYFKSYLKDIFGLLRDTSENNNSDMDNYEINNLLQERVRARLNKDYKKSDDIRDRLKDMGIIVEDGKDGQTWRKE